MKMLLHRAVVFQNSIFFLSQETRWVRERRKRKKNHPYRKGKLPKLYLLFVTSVSHPVTFLFLLLGLTK